MLCVKNGKFPQDTWERTQTGCLYQGEHSTVELRAELSGFVLFPFLMGPYCYLK